MALALGSGIGHPCFATSGEGTGPACAADAIAIAGNPARAEGNQGPSPNG